MAWYTTGTIAVSGTTVTGTGTNWTDNKQGIGPGQALLIPGAGTVKMYEIASVTSATKLTLKTSAGTVAAGQAYAIMSFYTDSVPDFARRLAAQLSYYQSQMDGWQQLLTSTDSVTLIAPDGSSVMMSSIAKLTADIATVASNLDGKVSKTATLGITDPNTITSTGWYQILNTATNVPMAVYAELQHVEVSSTVAVQIYHATTANRVFTRTRTNATTWTAWAESYSTVSKPALTDLAGVLAVANGGTGVTSIAALAASLGLSYYSPSATQVAVRIPYNGGSVLIQAGSVVSTMNSNGDTTISYPLAFGKVFTIITSNGDNANQAAGDGLVSVINFATTRTTSFDVNVQNRKSVPVRVHYIAIGT